MTFTEHHADPDAVRVRALAVGMGEIVVRYAAELDLAVDRIDAAIRGAQSARERLVDAAASAENFARLVARLEAGDLDAEALVEIGTTIEALEESLGIGPAPSLVAT